MSGGITIFVVPVKLLGALVVGGAITFAVRLFRRNVNKAKNIWMEPVRCGSVFDTADFLWVVRFKLCEDVRRKSL